MREIQALKEAQIVNTVIQMSNCLYMIKFRTPTLYHIGAIGAFSNYSTSDEVIGEWKQGEMKQPTACIGCPPHGLNCPLVSKRTASGVIRQLWISTA
jgi:hypothetical protein